MKKLGAFVLVLWILALALPIAVAWGAGPEEQDGEAVDALSPVGDDRRIKVLLSDRNEIIEMGLEEYIAGVVAAEMPVSFDLEALKAQAVAARSYTIYQMENNPGDPAHQGADVCTDYRHCKAYISKEDAKKKWGEAYYLKYWPKVEEAVRSTEGMILLYDDEPVNAVFHSTSGGVTENAKDVWGVDVPYLRSVESPGDADSPQFHSTVLVEKGQFEKVMAQELGVELLDAEWFLQNMRTEYTEAGSVKEITVEELGVKGTRMRELFNLKSAKFTMEEDEKHVLFHVTGYGHGVGMSQYGANALAQSGETYREILSWYYTGANIGTI